MSFKIGDEVVVLPNFVSAQTGTGVVTFVGTKFTEGQLFEIQMITLDVYQKELPRYLVPHLYLEHSVPHRNRKKAKKALGA